MIPTKDNIEILGLPSEPMLALFHHWINCSDIFELVTYQHNFSKLGLDDEAVELCNIFSSFHRLAVSYGLLYVVIEGYQALKLKDDEIDRLLQQSEYIQKLRRLRNSLFHYQKNRLPRKFWDFIFISDSEKWIMELKKSFTKYFNKEIPIKDFIEKYKESLHNK